MTAHHRTKIDGSKFYRDAGPKAASAILLRTASPIRHSHRLLAERLLKNVLSHAGLDFATR